LKKEAIHEGTLLLREVLKLYEAPTVELVELYVKLKARIFLICDNINRIYDKGWQKER
jgi:hypothetical protein